MTQDIRLREDLKVALKQKDALRASVIRLVLAEIKNAEIAQRKPLNDDKILDVISRAAKQYRESIEAFKQGNRNDLVAEAEAELAILQDYLPKQMSREEIIAAARQVIEASGAKEVTEKGRVMSQLMPQLKGKAEGKEVSDVVVELLSGS